VTEPQDASDMEQYN